MRISVYLPHYRTLFGILLFALLQPVQAATLGLMANYPNFALGSDQIYTYDANCDNTFSGECVAGQGKLTISGTVASYTEALGGSLVNQAVNNDTFSLVAILDIAGESVVSGSFTLTGQVLDDFPPFPPDVLYDSADHPSGTLLKGDLNLFGFSGDAAPSTGGILEFTFGNADGLIADPLFPLIELGAINYNAGGMILTVGTSTLGKGNFGNLVLSEDWTGTGFGDVFVPVPAAVWLFGSGLVALFGIGRGRRNR